MTDQWLDSDAIHYGLVNVSVANLRRLPVFHSELVNQMLLGQILPVYEYQNDFYFVQNWDGYRGWVSKHALVITDEFRARQWQEGPLVLFQQNYGTVAAVQKGEKGLILTDLAAGCTMKSTDIEEEYTTVALPDGRRGRVNTKDLVSLDSQRKMEPSAALLLNMINRFMGIPYHWGGTSSKGFDCSGLVQTIYRLMNHLLPRDASQMIHCGEAVDTGNGFSALKTGDLLFFGKSVRRVTHVAISLGGSDFVHAEGYVRRHSLDPTAANFNDYRLKTLLGVKRIL